MHTNEKHAPLAMTKLYANYPEIASSVLYFCVNPRLAATAPHKGFDEHDPNRSCHPDTVANPQSYEHERAAAALGFIATTSPDYVIDPHNTVCEGFGIAAMVTESSWNAEDSVAQKIVAASNIARVIVMANEAAKGTLIGAAPNAVTIEAQMSWTEQVAEDTAALIHALATDTSLAKKPFAREVYRIAGTVPKSEDPGLHVGNFELTIGHDGQPYYPIMLGTGPNSYRELEDRDYCCFRGILVGSVVL
jgi:succinylglutamate desuccinylase